MQPWWAWETYFKNIKKSCQQTFEQIYSPHFSVLYFIEEKKSHIDLELHKSEQQ